MFSVDDLLDKLGIGGQKRAHECYREEAANIVASQEDVAKLFPNVTLSDSKEVVYAPFRMCHSLPKINLRGRCFTPKTLSNSFGSVRDSLLNIDHQMAYRQGKDTICGHIVCGRFDPFGKYSEEVASKIPDEAIPLYALGAFYLKSQHVPAFLNEHLTGKRKWLTSMECSHQLDEADLYYRGEFIPIKDAESGMRECIGKNSIRPYKGHELALVLGGQDGKVDFHAAAVTPSPADDGASLLAFVTKHKYAEAANSGDSNPFFLPLEIQEFKKPASEEQEGQVSADELANISILGKTDPGGDDGHQHEMLSDGTIVPYNGHTHYLRSWSIARGTTPRFTGHTDTHHDYYRDGQGNSLSKVHIHLIDVPLRGKASAVTELETSVDGEATGSILADNSPLTLPEVPFDWEFSMSQTTSPLNDLLKRIASVLSTGKIEGANATEVASLRSDIQKFSTDHALAEMVKTEIANQITKGDLLTKDAATKLKEDAVKEVNDKAEAEKKVAAQRTARREKVLAMGIDLDAKFKDDLELTVGEFIDQFGLDDAGEKTFKVALATLETIKANSEAAETRVAQVEGSEEKPTDEQPSPATVGTDPQATVVKTETVAANKGGKAVLPTPKKKLLLVGGGSDEEEIAALPKPTSNGSKPARTLLGRAAFRDKI